MQAVWTAHIFISPYKWKHGVEARQLTCQEKVQNPSISRKSHMLTVFWDLKIEDPDFSDYINVKPIMKSKTSIFVKVNGFHP